jgi:hypothetical protein
VQIPKPYAVPVHVHAQPQLLHAHAQPHLLNAAPLMAAPMTTSFAMAQPMLLSQRPSTAGQTFAAPFFHPGHFAATVNTTTLKQ